MRYKKELKKGGLGIIALVILLLVTSIILLLDTYERHTIYLKRQNLQNVLTSANLSLYDAVRMGDKELLVPVGEDGYQQKAKYRPEEVETFLKLLNNENEENAIIAKYGTANAVYHMKDDLLNLTSISYLTEANKYKSIYIDKQEALEAFAEYLEKNLNVKRVSGMGNMAFISNDNTKFIDGITINSFYVRNAVNCWDENINGSGCCDYVANNKYTCVHIDMTIRIRTFTHLDQVKSMFRYSETTDMPIHIDTLIDYNSI